MQILSRISQAIKFIFPVLRYFTVADSWKLLTPCDVLLFAHNNDRALNVNGKSYSQLIHTVRYYLEKKEISCSGISTVFDVKNYMHNYYEDKTLNIVCLLNIIKAKFIALRGKRTYSEIKVNGEAKIWNAVLRKAQPKVVIGIQPSDALCIACHQLQIPIYDFQHGAITENSPHYGYELHLKKDVKRIPTGYLCWNNESANILNKWCSERNIKVEVLGNPWLYRFHTEDDSDFLIKSIRESKTFHSNKKRILITLQWGLADIYPEFFDKNDILHPVLLEAISKLHGEVMWLIRLHPIQMKSKKLLQKTKKLFKNHPFVDIEWSSNQPLPVVLSACHAHITWDSYVVAEAALLGIKSYVLNPGHFSTNRKLDINQYNKEISLPYIQQELDGLLRRSPSFLAADDVIAWVKEILADDLQRLSYKQCTFNLDKLYEIACRANCP